MQAIICLKFRSSLLSCMNQSRKIAGSPADHGVYNVKPEVSLSEELNLFSTREFVSATRLFIDYNRL